MSLKILSKSQLMISDHLIGVFKPLTLIIDMVEFRLPCYLFHLLSHLSCFLWVEYFSVFY